MANSNATTIVIFGASGDLTKRKLIPALFQLRQEKLLPEHTRIVGFARRKKTNEEYGLETWTLSIYEHECGISSPAVTSHTFASSLTEG